MIRVLLLSDTHSHMEPVILKRAAEVDEIWHAGDIGQLAVTEALKKRGQLRAVFGNIDGTEIRAEFPQYLSFDCEGVRIYMTHIAGNPGRYNSETTKAIQMERPDLVICGHSHILKVIRDPDYGHLHLNPGAIGRHGFHQVRTMLRFNINQGQIRDLEVLEYKR